MTQVTNLVRHEIWTKSGPVVSRLPGEEIESRIFGIEARFFR